jgi:hypothetical protein
MQLLPSNGINHAVEHVFLLVVMIERPDLIHFSWGLKGCQFGSSRSPDGRARLRGGGINKVFLFNYIHCKLKVL